MGDFRKLNRIKIQGFRSIEYVELELRALNVLIGLNGAGKSNFIGFFKLVRQIVAKNLQAYVDQQLGTDKLLFFGHERSGSLHFYLEFAPNAYAASLVTDADGRLVFIYETCQFFGDRRFKYSSGTEKTLLSCGEARESSLPDRPNRRTVEGCTVNYLRDWEVYHFHDINESSAVKQPGRIDKGRLLPQADNLAAFLWSMRGGSVWEKRAYELIVSYIQRVAPFFLDFVLEPERDNPELIRLRWKHRGSGYTFYASDFSDGTLRFICLAALLLQPEPPAIILLDGPELGLHPCALYQLADMMQLASDKTQVIAATQSAILINQFSPDDLILVSRLGDASQFRRISLAREADTWLDKFVMGTL